MVIRNDVGDLFQHVEFKGGDAIEWPFLFNGRKKGYLGLYFEVYGDVNCRLTACLFAHRAHFYGYGSNILFILVQQ